MPRKNKKRNMIDPQDHKSSFNKKEWIEQLLSSIYDVKDLINALEHCDNLSELLKECKAVETVYGRKPIPILQLLLAKIQPILLKDEGNGISLFNQLRSLVFNKLNPQELYNVLVEEDNITVTYLIARNPGEAFAYLDHLNSQDFQKIMYSKNHQYSDEQHKNDLKNEAVSLNSNKNPYGDDPDLLKIIVTNFMRNKTIIEDPDSLIKSEDENVERSEKFLNFLMVLFKKSDQALIEKFFNIMPFDVLPEDVKSSYPELASSNALWIVCKKFSVTFINKLLKAKEIPLIAVERDGVFVVENIEIQHEQQQEEQKQDISQIIYDKIDQIKNPCLKLNPQHFESSMSKTGLLHLINGVICNTNNLSESEIKKLLNDKPSEQQKEGNQGYEKCDREGILNQLGEMSFAGQMTQDEVKEQLRQAIDQQGNNLSSANVLEYHDNSFEANNSLDIINGIMNDNNSLYNIILGHGHIVAVARVNNIVYVIDGIGGNHALTTRLSEILHTEGAEVRVVNTSFQTDFNLVNQCGHIAVSSLIAAVDYIENNNNFSIEQLQQHISEYLAATLLPEKKTLKAGADVDLGLNYEDDSDDDNDPVVESDNILQRESGFIIEDLSNQHYYSYDGRHDLLSDNDSTFQSIDIRDDASILCPSMLNNHDLILDA